MPLPAERLPGRHELRPSDATRPMAVGTLACPGCDAPVLPSEGGMAPSDPLACGYCGHDASVRDFLSLGEPTRPTHVAVRVRLTAVR